MDYSYDLCQVNKTEHRSMLIGLLAVPEGLEFNQCIIGIESGGGIVRAHTGGGTIDKAVATDIGVAGRRKRNDRKVIRYRLLPYASAYRKNLLIRNIRRKA